MESFRLQVSCISRLYRSKVFKKFSHGAAFYCLEIKLVLLVLTALVTGAFGKDYVTFLFARTIWVSTLSCK